MVRQSRALASTIRVPADRRVGDVLDHPIAGVQRNMVFEQELRRRWVDPQHRRLAEVEAGGDRDRVPGAHAATLGPVLAFEIDDQIAGLDIGHSGADRADPADAFRARGRRQGRMQAVIAAAEGEVRRVDRKREHVEHDLAGLGGADIRRLDAFGHRFRRAIGSNLDLFHRPVPPSALLTGASLSVIPVRSEGSSPESMNTSLWNMDSGFAAARRPGMRMMCHGRSR
jgi:hypothetical protein